MTDLIKTMRDEACRQEDWANDGEATVVGLGPELLTRGADRIEQLEALLHHAKCPNEECIDGAIAIQVQANNRDGWDYGLEHCQWCDERKALLAEDRE